MTAGGAVRTVRGAALAQLLSLALSHVALGAASASCSAYRPGGPYPQAGEPGVERVLEQFGVREVGRLPLRLDAESGLLYRNVDDIAFYGLEGWTHWRRTHAAAGLAQARRSGDWLVAHQARDGGWHYPVPFALGSIGVERTLRPGWIAAQAQGDSISLLVRLYHATGDGRYLRTAKRGLEPFARGPVGRHGFRAIVRGHVFYDGFPSNPPSLVLEDFQISLLGLADLASLDARAQRLLRQGLRSLYWALPLLDNGEGKPIYSLTYVSVPGAPKIYLPAAHTLNAGILCELSRRYPSPQATRYAARWEASDPHAYYR